MERVIVDPKRPLVEYPRIAQALGLRPGDEVEVEIEEDEVRLRRATRAVTPDDLLAGRGMLANRPDVTRDILSMRDEGERNVPRILAPRR